MTEVKIIDDQSEIRELFDKLYRKDESCKRLTFHNDYSQLLASMVKDNPDDEIVISRAIMNSIERTFIELACKFGTTDQLKAELTSLVDKSPMIVA